MNRSTQAHPRPRLTAAIIALAATVSLAALIPSAQAQMNNSNPQRFIQNVNGQLVTWYPSHSGWYTDGGGSGSAFPYHPGFHAVPAPPPAPFAY